MTTTVAAGLPTSESSNEAESMEHVELTATTPSSSTNGTLSRTRQQLEKLTIRELRQLLPRGGEDAPGLGTLKLKREIVDYIWERMRRRRRLAAVGDKVNDTTRDDENDDDDNNKSRNDDVTATPTTTEAEMLNDNSTSAAEIAVTTTPEVGVGVGGGSIMSSSTRVRIKRASIVDGTEHTVWKRGNSTSLMEEEIGRKEVWLSPPPQRQQQQQQEQRSILSPKDKIMLDVLRRYPPLRSTSMLGQEKRQQQQQSSSSSDAGTTMNTMNIETYDTEDGIVMQKPLASSSSSSSSSSNNHIQQQQQQQQQQQHNHRISSWNNYIGPFGIGEADIRQTYHPMLVNVTQSDMDIIFVGTASCTPGITRGVSCTALRLTWRRNNDNNDNIIIVEDNENVESSSSRVNTGGGGIGTWLFDCGESTQLSIQRTPSIRPGRITKIFITHCHGDHSFGLPGLLCLMGTDRTKETTTPPVDIYGPEGLRMWLRVAIRYSVSRVVPPYRVHELMDIPMAPEWVEGHRKNGRYYMQPQQQQQQNNNMNNYSNSRGGNGGGGSSSEENDGNMKCISSNNNKKRWAMQGLAGADTTSWISRAPMINLEPSRDFGEVEGGRDIYPIYDHPQSFDGAPVWNVINNDGSSSNNNIDADEGNEDNDDVVVHAAPMSHGVPCVGYVIRERDRPGRLRPELVLPVIERNRVALVQSGIVKNPMKIMSIIKNLKPGTSYTFPDGTVLHQEDVVEPTRTGRKVVICGDTADSRALEVLAKNANVVIHEATNTYLPGIDKDSSMNGVTRDTMIHGHSTPSMAGEFAKRINAKKLVLNHFSARYKGDQSLDSITIMTRIERQARKASGLAEDSVAAAWDFMILPVPR